MDADRERWLSWWNGLCVFVGLWYLTGSVFKAAVVAAFCIGSSFLRYGHRWILRGGLAVSAVAIAVFLGVPHPAELWEAKEALLMAWRG
jgi:hypothetical protein